MQLQLQLPPSFAAFASAAPWRAAPLKRYAAATAPAPTRSVALDKRSLFIVEQPMGLSIECTAGALWVTHDHQPEDACIDAGQTHVVRYGSRMILQALEAASFRLHQRP